jgi:hypothetical protein
MSAYKTLTCTFRDKETLLESLNSLGWHPVVGAVENLRGWEDDQRDMVAEIIVKKEEISKFSNDLGFLYDTKLKEYLMLCSDYDCKIGVSDKVKQNYAITAIKKALVKNKFSINSEIKNSNKNVVLTAGKII